MGPGDDHISPGDDDGEGDDDNNDISGNEPTPSTGGIRVVRTLRQDYFKRKLIEHFDILFRQNKIKWPSRS
jgi:hypothetical protein